ncbi:MAG: flavodoxin family protein [Pseudomonadota bacterium]
MSIQVLGVSGSPVKNSNTDRLVQAVLASTGLEAEFVKLSNIMVRPCHACKRCVEDNVCKVRDDFPSLAEKVKQAGALIVGGYSPYRSLDAFSKAFLERLWSLRHVKNLVRGKLAVTVVTGTRPETRDRVSEMMAMEMIMDRMELLGQLKVQGNVPCLTCGEGDTCEMSGVPRIFGQNAKASADKCVRVEDQTEVWEEAQRLGRLMGERLRNIA